MTSMLCNSCSLFITIFFLSLVLLSLSSASFSISMQCSSKLKSQRVKIFHSHLFSLSVSMSLCLSLYLSHLLLCRCCAPRSRTASLSSLFLRMSKGGPEMVWCLRIFLKYFVLYAFISYILIPWKSDQHLGFLEVGSGLNTRIRYWIPIQKSVIIDYFSSQFYLKKKSIRWVWSGSGQSQSGSTTLVFFVSYCASRK